MTGQTNGKQGKHDLRQPDAINPALLRQDAYFEDLMRATYDAGLVGDDEAQRVQMECLQLLADKMKKYTSGSSSFAVDDAENIMKSNLYTIGLYLKSFPHINDAVAAVKTRPIAELYSLGQICIKDKLTACRQLYKEIFDSMTAEESEPIEQFFALYNDYWTWYNAHEIPPKVRLRFPALYEESAKEFAGVECMERYLQVVAKKTLQT